MSKYDPVTRVMGFDMGRNWGWAFGGENIPVDGGSEKFVTLAHFYEKIDNLLTSFKPQIAINCRGFGIRNFRIFRVQFAMAGVLELACERNDVRFLDIGDNTMRKVVIGNGRASKDDVMKAMKVDDHDQADAMLAVQYFFMLDKEV